MEDILKTCLHQKHLDLGAKMMPFGGFDMPIEYTTIIEEHNAVRHAAGIFDVSHMGEILITGPDSERYINHIFTNDIRNAEIGKIFYGHDAVSRRWNSRRLTGLQNGRRAIFLGGKCLEHCKMISNGCGTQHRI